MAQELLLAHCLKTFALSLLLQAQAPGKQGFLAPGSPPPPHWACIPHSLLLTPSPGIGEPSGFFPLVSPVSLNYNLAEPVAVAPTKKKRPIEGNTLPPRTP